MTITIENASTDLAKAIKCLVKLDNAKCKVHKDKATKREEYLKKLAKEADETLRLYQEGKIKAYKNAKEMHKAIFDEV